MTKRLATDITCVERMGLDTWIEGFDWPVDDAEFRGLTDLLAALRAEACRPLSGEELDVWLSEGVAVWLAQVAHGAAVEGAARRKGLELDFGPVAQALYRPDWGALGRDYARQLDQPRMRLGLRRLARNVAFNRDLPPLRRAKALVAPDAVALGSNDRLRARFAQGRGLGVDNTYIPLLANGAGRAELTIAMRGALRSFADGLVSALAEGFGASMDADGLCRALEGRMGDLKGVYRAVHSRVRALPLLVTESAKPLHKAAACAWRAGGGTATGFAHGHAVGEMRLPERSYHEFFAYDEFVCSTQASARAFAADHASTEISRRRPVRFVVPPPQGAAEALPDWRCGFPERVRTVMILGFPMNSTRYPNQRGLYWASQLELEVRLVRLLAAAGFEVLYKVHPERPQPVTRIMESLDCRVVSERFEQVAGQADAFVTKYILSTAFGAMRMTNRPIYLLDAEDDVWEPRCRELLGRRCVCLDASYDGRGRMVFDEAELVARLSGRQELPDFSYVTEYCMP